MDDRYFWELLGLEPGADRRALKRAYHQLARQNHPDFYPPEEKALQGLRMITLNEAYAHLLRRTGVEAGEADEQTPAGPAEDTDDSCSRPADPRQAPAGARSAAAQRVSPAEQPAPGVALGFHREPAYAYYKQGFVHYSRAIHGIQALYRSIRRLYPAHFDPRDDAYERFAGSLTELRRAHEYFQRVTQEHGESVWAPDARVKLARVERFSELYRRILRNLTEGRRPAP